MGENARTRKREAEEERGTDNKSEGGRERGSEEKSERACAPVRGIHQTMCSICAFQCEVHMREVWASHGVGGNSLWM